MGTKAVEKVAARIRPYIPGTYTTEQVNRMREILAEFIDDEIQPLVEALERIASNGLIPNRLEARDLEYMAKLALGKFNRDDQH